MLDDYVTIEVNGHQADQAVMSLLEYEGWGYFTAMPVRGGRTRGLDLHLSRLEAAHHDVYGRALGGQEVRARIRHALSGRPDASVRVYGYWAGMIVTVREPQDMPRRPHSMTAVHFQRPLARLKHVGSWGQGQFRQAALAAGFDEGLLADETGRISEGTITNVGLWRDGTVIWPTQRDSFALEARTPRSRSSHCSGSRRARTGKWRSGKIGSSRSNPTCRRPTESQSPLTTPLARARRQRRQGQSSEPDDHRVAVFLDALVLLTGTAR